MIEIRSHYTQSVIARGETLQAALTAGLFNLSSADLHGANLRAANLQQACLYCADLSKADLCGANLSGANLSGADLSGADLRHADFVGAFLQTADLSGARLNWRSHDLLAEILRCAAGGDGHADVDKLKIAGFVLLSPRFCWGDFLALGDPLTIWALDTLVPWLQEGDFAPDELFERRDQLTQGTTP